MDRRLWIVCGLLLGGCSAMDAPESTPVVNKALSSQIPEYVNPSPAKLPNGRRWIALGENEDRAFSIFPRPSRGFPLEETIPGLSMDFVSKGWETTTEGFGIILHEDQIVLAMHQYESIEADEFAQVLELVKDANGIDHFTGTSLNGVDYWYTFFGHDELVISRIPGPKKRYQVTITIGYDKVVQALGILKDVTTATKTSSI
ncbi:MAG: hypothetical protein JST51_04035 [Armatimonadetes bacterium]|nr:hypothetical protein [Armatimonadota bacterium]